LAQKLFPAPEPFLASDAHKAAELFNSTGRRSRSLADCQIAAVALRCKARLATSNISDFAIFQVHGLELA
jgi:predicted nucleic acid-binding protein